MPAAPLLDCVIVGAGPAGLVAALYLRRFHRRIAVLDGGDARALRIARSHNVPGFPGGIGGAELLERLGAQVSAVGTTVTPARVEAIETRPDDGFRVKAGRDAWQARTVLLCTGALDGEPDLPGRDTLRERGLLRQCPICDGHEHAGQRLLVIGQGDHGAREALFLRHYSAHIALAVPTGKTWPTPPMAQALQARGVTLLAAPPRALHADGDAVVLEDAVGAHHRFDVAYAALGCHPRTELTCALQPGTDGAGNLAVDRHGMTDVPGLFAAGDVTGGLDQISVAMGQAAIAATAIHNRLR